MTDRPRQDDRKEASPARSLAVALHHDSSRSDAPKVVASGRGAVAEQILQLAFASGVPVREDADLAEILAAIEIEAELPVDCWAAIAEVLAHVYRANGEWTEILAATRQREATE